MGSMGIICLVALHRLQPRPGVCATAGMVAVFLKVFTLGGLYPGPVIGITAQAVLMELVFLMLRSGPAGAVLGGALALAINPFQKVLMTLVVAGPEAVRAAVQVVQAAAGRVGLHGIDGPGILVALAVFHGGFGALVGAVAWVLAGRVLRRLGRSP